MSQDKHGTYETVRRARVYQSSEDPRNAQRAQGDVYSLCRSGLGCTQLQKGFPGLRKAVVPSGIGRAAVSFFDGSGGEEGRLIRTPWASVMGKFLIACLGQFLAR